ncbi:MAG: hypothetical protein GWP19_14205, partial [Planctomycetia bacterium]|nr:hypothetical protein [Planctomycetia bacterium]
NFGIVIFIFIVSLFIILNGNFELPLLQAVVGLDECYQETATEANACGGLSGGTYTFTGFSETSLYDALKTFDGSWDSRGTIAGLGMEAYLTIDYKKPVGASSFSTWKFLSYSPTSNLPQIISIPVECWTAAELYFPPLFADILRLRGFIEYYYTNQYIENTYAQCYNGTDWITLATFGKSSDIYEEAMIWEIGKLPYGSDCNVDEDCDSNICFEGICSLPEGSCLNDDDCLTNEVCINNICESFQTQESLITGLSGVSSLSSGDIFEQVFTIDIENSLPDKTIWLGFEVNATSDELSQSKYYVFDFIKES